MGYPYEDLLKTAASETDTLISDGHYAIYQTGDTKHDYYNMFIMEDKSNLSEAILYIDYSYPIRTHNMGHGAVEANAGFSKDFVDCFLYSDGLPKALTSCPHDDETLQEELANRDPRAAQLIRMMSSSRAMPIIPLLAMMMPMSHNSVLRVTSLLKATIPRQLTMVTT